MSALVLRGNARCLPLPVESVDLIVTSPPYFALRSYQDGGEHYQGQVGGEPTPQEFIESLWACTTEWWRVLKPTGSLFVNLGDKYAGSGGHNNSSLAPARTGEFGKRKHNAAAPRVLASRRSAPDRYNQESDGIRKKSLIGLPWRYALGCIDGKADVEGLGWILRAEIVWSKPNGLPESVTDRVRRSHEQWFHLTKSGSYFSDPDRVRESYTGTTNTGDPTPYGRDGDTRHGRDGSTLRHAGANPFGRIPGSVWSVATEPLIISDEVKGQHGLPDHFAAFPTEWPRRLILGWSPPDGVVLDPFGGTGTTAMVARALGRKGISLDLSADYCRLASWRIFKSGHGAKAVSRTWGERQGVMAL